MFNWLFPKWKPPQLRKPLIWGTFDKLWSNHDRVLKAKDARIAELEAIIESRGM